MKKKSGILLFVILTAFMLSGWGKKEVKLLDSSKLIDLNKAIELAKPGGMAGDNGEEGDSSTSNPDRDSGSENRTARKITEAAARNIVIRIRGDKISYTCGTFTRENFSPERLESRIRTDYVSGAGVTLKDDFAEAHVYKAVLEVLDGLKNNIGLNYSEVQLTGGE